MAATNDTINGLLAEFRGYAAGMPPSYHVTMSWADFRKMLDRFDAAHKREVAVSKTETTTNAVKLREALEKCANWGEQIDCQLGSSDATVYAFRNERCLAHNISECARAALAEPVKNCEVGTAEEQYERYKRRCKAQDCRDCPVRGNFKRIGSESCQLVWAQMPYEEGGAK